jgi:Na+/H+ antiporter NhaD/arsenite permease-like protein
MLPPILLSLLTFIPLAYLIFRRDLIVQASSRPRVSALEGLISGPVLLRKSLIVIAGVLIGFTLHGALQLEPATIAMTGAAILMWWSKKEPHHVLQHVEWTTLLFFVGLFITVESLVKVGIIEMIAQKALALTQGNLMATSFFVLWLSAIVSGVVDNIPYTATMIPLVKSLGAAGMQIETLWWSLALGADLGGNFTLVGASANVVVASFAERSGYRITFVQFFKYSFLITFITMLISTIYVWIRYLA